MMTGRTQAGTAMTNHCLKYTACLETIVVSSHHPFFTSRVYEWCEPHSIDRIWPMVNMRDFDFV